jgi:tetratricopeptide (TPR) repeat protein
MHYKGARKALPEIAKELNVDAVVEGTVFKAGDRVRVSAQLVDAAKDQHLWARHYESNLQDVLTIQRDLASSIALEVAGNLSPSEQSRLRVQRRQPNPQAYEAFLKGQYFLERWTFEGFAKSKDYFEQSISLDPTYADGYMGLAEYYGTVAFMGVVPPREAWLKSEELLTRALEIDNNSSKAHALLGLLKFQFRCDRAGAEKELNYSLELNPADMWALDYHSFYLLQIGRIDEAIAEKRRVLEHDPLAVITNAELGLYLIEAGRADEAIAQLKKTIELDPNYPAAHARLGVALAAKQRYAEAVNAFQKAISLDRTPVRMMNLAVVYARWGKRQEALRIIRELQQMSKTRYVSPSMSALIYARLGEKEAAIASLQKAKPEDEPKVTDHGFDSLRSDRRFKLLEARLKPDPACASPI